MDKILWVDLEMTGLDPCVNVIIEIAAIVTSVKPPFDEIDQYHAIVRQHQEHLDKMDSWNTKVHKASGLLDLIPSGKTNLEAEESFSQFIEKHFQKTPAVIAGNSISQDRAFIKAYLPKVEQKLHYRMLDVTAWKLILENENLVFEKKNIHRALSDIQESLLEMRFYMNFLDQNKIKMHSLTKEDKK